MEGVVLVLVGPRALGHDLPAPVLPRSLFDLLLDFPHDEIEDHVQYIEVAVGERRTTGETVMSIVKGGGKGYPDRLRIVARILERPGSWIRTTQSYPQICSQTLSKV